MSRLGKLFGRKNSQASDDKELPQEDEAPSTRAEDQPAPVASQGSQTIPLTPDEEFGLKFIFESGESSEIFTSVPIYIGRNEENHIVLKDDSVSAVHARIYYDERIKDICIVDNDSVNGLFIDNQPTVRNVLFDGVSLKLGNVNLTFRDTGYLHSS